MAGDDGASVALDLLLRELDYYLGALNSLRTNVGAMFGVGTTINLALAALAFRDRRTPDPGWVPVAAFVILAAALVVGALIIRGIRHAVDWPSGSSILAEQRGSAIDLRERYLSEFRNLISNTKSSLNSLELWFLGLVALLALSACIWIWVVSHTPLPPVTP